MSKIKNLGYTWMALNTFQCKCLTPLNFKGLIPTVANIAAAVIAVDL